MHHLTSQNLKIAIIGLGYVGLPLAIEFSKHYDVIGYDINQNRIHGLTNGTDECLEVQSGDILDALDENLVLTCQHDDLASCNFFIVTVPTPIDEFNKPNLSALVEASEVVSCYVSEGNYVVYESTVYPGVTEDICGPILKNGSGLEVASEKNERNNGVFFLGYSPERINPGDKTRGVGDIVKVTSGCTKTSAHFVDQIYRKICKSGTHLAPSIRIAEAAKVIENIQRDVNIALVNELSQIFNILDLDTNQIIDAASSKWNFMPFRPGLVGGHCIGVDPYYLTHKAKEVGFNPEMILAGRSINEKMTRYVAERLKTVASNNDVNLDNASVLLLGLTFKENCPDTRNSKIRNLIYELEELGCQVQLDDPHLRGSDFDGKPIPTKFAPHLIEPVDVIMLAVPHAEYVDAGISELRNFGKEKHLFFDLKGAFDACDSDFRL